MTFRGTISDRNHKYPTSRLIYNTIVGEIRENRIAKATRDILPNNFKVSSHKVNVNGADICVSHNGKILGKFEVLNENISSYIDEKRALRIRKNLKSVPYKGLICSHPNSINGVKRILKNIPVLALGFQTLPSHFHRFYQHRSQIFKRKIANNRSFKLLKNIVLGFFYAIGFNSLMYIATNSTISKYDNHSEVCSTNDSRKTVNVEASEDKRVPELCQRCNLEECNVYHCTLLNCNNCTRRYSCSTMMFLEYQLEEFNKVWHPETPYQCMIDQDPQEIKLKDQNKRRQRIKEILPRIGELKDKRDKCLRQRRHAYKKGYYCFDDYLCDNDEVEAF